MKKIPITKIEALEVLDSRGNPTVQATVWTKYGKSSASVPSGASTGTHEALELRDGDIKRYAGLGVQKAVKNVNTVISKKIVGMNACDQESLDTVMLTMDGTENKEKLGANAILAVSMAASRAAAQGRGIELYEHIGELAGKKPELVCVPMCNLINGGAHADSGLDLQEFMILPRAPRFSERLRVAAEIYHVLKKNLSRQGMVVAVGDEGGFAPRLPGNEEALDELVRAIKDAGYVPGKQVDLAIDAAASEFYDAKSEKYNLSADKTILDSKGLLEVYRKWMSKYPLVSIEDGFAEDHFSAWQEFTKNYGKKLTIVGDDLFVTSTKRLQMGIDEKLANAILIKVNQIGTVTETLDAVRLAQNNKFKVAVSHRSGETSDTFIADLAVGVNAEFIKTGSLARGERVSKYNRLLEIEKQLLSN